MTERHCIYFNFANTFDPRRPLSQGEILNCDLTEQDTSKLDEYNSYDFYESAVTDFYELDASCGGSAGVDDADKDDVNGSSSASNDSKDKDQGGKKRTEIC